MAFYKKRCPMFKDLLKKKKEADAKRITDEKAKVEEAKKK